MTSEQYRANHDVSSSSCHWIPCSVAIDGTAAVDLYFQPKLKTLSTSESPHTNSITEKNSAPIQSATFRGRGLLAFQPTELPSDISGYILSMDATNKQAVVKGSFRFIHEWEHEWDENEFTQKLPTLEQVRGLEYLQIMKALHEPIQPSE